MPTKEQRSPANADAQKHWEMLIAFHAYKQQLFAVAPKRCTGNY